MVLSVLLFNDRRSKSDRKLKNRTLIISVGTKKVRPKNFIDRILKVRSFPKSVGPTFGRAIGPFEDRSLVGQRISLNVKFKMNIQVSIVFKNFKNHVFCLNN